MSKYHSGDIVEFKQDNMIVGEIYTTWSDVDTPPRYRDRNIFVHRSTPEKALKAWFNHRRIAPGFVMVEFLLPQNGLCLVAEQSLRLRDRGFVLGDVVKRKPSDAQSGRILSLSAECTLLPACSKAEYASNRPLVAQNHRSQPGKRPPLPHTRRGELHGFPDNNQARKPRSESELDLFTVPAGELSTLHDYEEDDFVIYDDWIGRIRTVWDEVTVRLTNGSVVVVQETDELEVPYFIPGSPPYELMQRLHRADYYRRLEQILVSHKTRTDFSYYFYPGQTVRTKKGNLRRGRWIFGSYDPSIEPQGIVAEVRAVGLEVQWLMPNFLDSNPERDAAPPSVLNMDVLQSGEIKLLSNDHIPLQPLAKTLDSATDREDLQLGAQVRLSDPLGAAVKYGPGFERIPRTETQGYDMNALHITSTRTNVLVQWQDGSLSDESSISLVPTQSMDVNDVWPGDKVSLKTDETTTSIPIPGVPESGGLEGRQPSRTVLHAKTIGVVQTINAVERLAKVRWFQNADFKLDIDEQSLWHPASPSSTYGQMTERISEVSLYDISVYGALFPNLGDYAVARPTVPTLRPQLADYLGRVVELCLDGEVIIRCYAASQPRDIKVAISDLTVVATADFLEGEGASGGATDETEDVSQRSDERSIAADEERDKGYDGFPEPIDVQIEYEGGESMNIDEDEDAWSTDDSMRSPSNASYDPSLFPSEPLDPTHSQSEDGSPMVASALGHADSQSEEVPARRLAHAWAPAPFLVLEDDPPTDHKYIGQIQMAIADIGRKAMKEHKVMRSSLPDGVFVRTWESRLDLLRVLIVGPLGTPFEHSPYLFDLQLADPFPDVPPKVFFHSWTKNLGRINPNLYKDGKVCLSLLGTWPANRKHEAWSRKSTVLQILVSIMGLVLVKEPYYNEAGFEVLVGSEDSAVSSRMYSERAFVMAKGFIRTALCNPPAGFADIVYWLYRAYSGPRLLDRVICDCQDVSQRSLTTSQTDPLKGKTMQNKDKNLITEESWVGSVEKLSTGALVLLHRHIENLVKYDKGNEPKTSAATAGTIDEGDTVRVDSNGVQSQTPLMNTFGSSLPTIQSPPPTFTSATVPPLPINQNLPSVMDTSLVPSEESGTLIMTPLVARTLGAISDAYHYCKQFFSTLQHWLLISFSIDNVAHKSLSEALAPPAQALAPHVVSKLSNITEPAKLKSGSEKGRISPSKRGWIVRPGLLWYHAPLVAIDLVSKNPYNVDWASKPPFASLYDSEGHLKEGVFPQRWTNTMTTRPERKAQRVKRLNRAARIRAEVAAEVLETEELEARLIWNLRDIRPRPHTCEEHAALEAVEERFYEDFPPKEAPDDAGLSSQTALSWGEGMRRNLSALPISLETAQHVDWEMLLEMNPMASITHRERSFGQYKGQDRGVLAWLTTLKPSPSITATRADSVNRANAMSSAFTAEEPAASGDYVDVPLPGDEYGASNTRGILIQNDSPTRPLVPPTEQDIWPWNGSSII